MRSHFQLFALALLTVVTRAAGAPVDDATRLLRKAALRKPNITVEMRCLSLPQATALPLIRRLRSARVEEKAAALTEVDALLAHGRATLLAWPLVTVREGDKATAYGEAEVRFGSVYQAGSVSVCLTDIPREPRREPAIVDAPVVAGIDTRGVGTQFEVEATIIPGGKALDLAFFVRLIGWPTTDRIAVERERTAEGKTVRMVVEQPRFSTVEHGCKLTLESGEQRLVQISADPNAEG
ncbi:MAG TPA: hypothetical protein VGO11_02415, partial [Chthoniobacteraceae bacterium]|nr:hypothetical protein [Chthoniobacteraceae bacterium]